MRTHSQNLNEGGSMFWKGRAWFYGNRSRYDELFHVEWLFGKFARNFAASVSFGHGDSDNQITLHVCLPFVFSVYLCLPGWRMKEPHKTGLSIHDGAIWIHVFTNENTWDRDQPWWEKTKCINFPWALNWFKTEVLSHSSPLLAAVVYTEMRGDRKRLGIDSFKMMDRKGDFEKQHSETYDYEYLLKNGTVQKRTATVFVSRMTWRARWWPLIPRSLSRTSIEVKFNEEVGERTGSWKGGCVGCGYDMRPTESPLDCLRRMERERKFN